MDDLHSGAIEEFLHFLRVSEEEYRIKSMLEQEAENETQDILHCLELYDNSDGECLFLAQALCKSRRKRRAAKDYKQVSEPVTAWIKENRKVINGLQALLGQVRKAESRIENRHYNPRTDIVERILQKGMPGIEKEF